MPRLYQVDAFTDKPFCGNPAAVCLLDGPADEPWMQQVAAEMNLAETAFVYAESSGFRLRWFTPAVEVELCGHATLASSHILWQTGMVDREHPCVFHSLSGQLTAIQTGDQIQLDFPAAPTVEKTAPDGLLAALGVQPLFTGLSTWDWLVEVADPQELGQMQPNHAELRQLGMRGVIVTTADSTGEFDFVSRFFVPGAGIDEDPVTGSAHCALGPYWQPKLGKSEFSAWQASPRGGHVNLEVQGDRVLLRGHAVTVLQGELIV